MKKFSFLIATLSALAAVFAFTTSQVWKINSTYSIAFSNSDVSGIFNKFSGTVDFDENSLTTSKFAVVIDVASINTGNAMQNKHAKDAEWFDVTKYPNIKFTSSKIEKDGDHYKVTGTFEIKDVKKDLAFPFTFKKNGNNATFAANFSINKNDFHVGKAGDGVGELIVLKLSIPVTK